MAEKGKKSWLLIIVVIVVVFFIYNSGKGKNSSISDNHSADSSTSTKSSFFGKEISYISTGSTDDYISSDSRFTKNNTKYCYNELTNEKQRRVYMQFENYVNEIDNELYGEYFYKIKTFELRPEESSDSTTDNDVETAYIAFYADNPQYFWLGGYERLYDKSSKTNILGLLSYFSSDEVTRMKSELNSDISRFYSSIPSGLTGYYLEKYVHDYIIDICEYNIATKNAKNDSEVYNIQLGNHSIGNAYGAIHNGDAVCNGYSQAFQLLCKCVGLDCIYIVGTYSGESHAWNAVRLSGSWYLSDITGDDTGNPYSDRKYYYYFNLTTRQMSEDHSALALNSGGTASRNLTNIFLPECTDTTYNYYAYDEDCVHIQYIDGYQLGEDIIKALNAGKKSIAVYFDPRYIDYNDAINLIYQNGNDSYWYGYADYVRNNSSYDTSSSSFGSYSKCETRNALEINF